MSKKHVCLVCGRVFHEGQGVKIAIGGREYMFHSKSCAIKFFRAFLLYLEPDVARKAAEETRKEFEEKLKQLQDLRKKRIEELM